MWVRPLLKRVRSVRNGLARRYYHRRLLRRDFTIISDDCWGGRVYSDLGLACRSPLVRMGIRGTEYLDFVCGMREPGALDVLSVSMEETGYPVIQTRNALMRGLHYASIEEFVRTFERRRKTMLWDRIFIKIDLGKAKYRPEDIARWNALKLPNAVALYPDTPYYRALNIHQGVAIPDWETDGARMFLISCRRFDIVSWLNHGTICRPFGYRCAQLMLLNHALIDRLRLFLWRRFPDKTAGS